jgi:predicted transcriptional regulator
MNIQAEKLEIMRLIMDTDDKSIIDQLKAFFQTRPTSKVWFDDLPDAVKESVERGLAQSERGEVIPHSEVKRKYEKWLSK